MDNILMPPDTDGGEAGPSSSSDYVTISREELDALRSRAESSAPPPDGVRDPGLAICSLISGIRLHAL